MYVRTYVIGCWIQDLKNILYGSYTHRSYDTVRSCQKNFSRAFKAPNLNLTVTNHADEEPSKLTIIHVSSWKVHIDQRIKLYFKDKD